MHYSLQIKRSAVKALNALQKIDRELLIAAIDRLCEFPASGSALKGELEGMRRLRVGGEDWSPKRCLSVTKHPE